MTRPDLDRERILAAYLRTRGAMEPPDGLLEEVTDLARSEPQGGSRQLIGWARLLAVPATALTAIVLVLALKYVIDRLRRRAPRMRIPL